MVYSLRKLCVMKKMSSKKMSKSNFGSFSPRHSIEGLPFLVDTYRNTSYSSWFFESNKSGEPYLDNSEQEELIQTFQAESFIGYDTIYYSVRGQIVTT